MVIHVRARAYAYTLSLSWNTLLCECGGGLDCTYRITAGLPLAHGVRVVLCPLLLLPCVGACRCSLQPSPSASFSRLSFFLLFLFVVWRGCANLVLLRGGGDAHTTADTGIPAPSLPLAYAFFYGCSCCSSFPTRLSRLIFSFVYRF